MASQSGVSSLSLKTIAVRVRRQNSEVETVALGKTDNSPHIPALFEIFLLPCTDREFKRFLQDNFPAWRSEMITTGFTFDLKGLQATEGFPEAAKKLVESKGGRLDRMTAQQRAEMTKLRGWTTQAYGMFAKYKVTVRLQRALLSHQQTNFQSIVFIAFMIRQLD